MFTALVRGLLCCLLAYITWIKSYTWSSTFEHFALGLLLFVGRTSIWFSEMQTAKVLVSFIFFVFNLSFLKKNKQQHLPTLRYLLGSWRKLLEWGIPSCHAWLAIDDKIYHAELDNGDRGDTAQRFYGLTPKRDNKRNLVDILRYRFYAPCVGFGVPDYNEEDIVKKLDCGKCHDYTAITLYSLSCHKFLTYSVMAYVRWMSWLVMAIAMICHGLLYFIVNSAGFTCTTAQYDFVLHYLSAFIDILHMLITGIDIVNIIGERLEDTDESVSKVFKFRGFLSDALKFCLQLFIVLIYINRVSIDARFYAYYLYLFVCFVIGSVVSLIVDSSQKKEASESWKDA